MTETTELNRDPEVTGESFSLPSGFSWGEDDGDLVAFDTSGNVALRYDETTSEFMVGTSTVAIDGDEQPPEVHGNQSHEVPYAEDDKRVEEFDTDGIEGTAPVSQGDGTLTMQEVGAGGDGYEQPEDGTFDINLEP